MFSNFEYFEAIINHESLSKAAKHLGISQPALSSYLSKLEEKVGHTLFNRSKTPIVLTHAGKVYYKYFKKITSIKNSYLNEISDFENIYSGSLTMAGASSVTSCYLQKVTAQFAAKYPDIKINIVEGVVMDIARQTSNDEIDFFITPEKIGVDEFNYIPLLEERLLVCIPECLAINNTHEFASKRIPIEHILSGKTSSNTYTPIDGSLLRDEKFVLIEAGTNVRTISELFFAKYEITPVNPVEVRQLMTGFNLTTNGVGISFIPESMLRFGNFGQFPLIYAMDEAFSKRKMYICYKKDKYMSSASLAYINMLKEYLQQA